MERDSQLNKEFGEAFDNPYDFDFGFEAEREESGFANFGFDPVEAAKLRQAEYDRQNTEPATSSLSKLIRSIFGV